MMSEPSPYSVFKFGKLDQIKPDNIKALRDKTVEP